MKEILFYDCKLITLTPTNQIKTPSSRSFEKTNLKLRTNIQYQQYWDLVRKRIFDRHRHTLWSGGKKRHIRQVCDFLVLEHMMAIMNQLYINRHNFQWAKE